jgi:hypothetical protein
MHVNSEPFFYLDNDVSGYSLVIIKESQCCEVELPMLVHRKPHGSVMFRYSKLHESSHVHIGGQLITRNSQHIQRVLDN